MPSNRRIFSDADADVVWVNQFGQASQGHDVTGKLLRRNGHGTQWDVDHIMPYDMGGSSTKLANLQVLNSNDNQNYKRDNYPSWRDSNGVSHTQFGTR